MEQLVGQPGVSLVFAINDERNNGLLSIYGMDEYTGEQHYNPYLRRDDTRIVIHAIYPPRSFDLRKAYQADEDRLFFEQSDIKSRALGIIEDYPKRTGTVIGGLVELLLDDVAKIREKNEGSLGWTLVPPTPEDMDQLGRLVTVEQEAKLRAEESAAWHF